MPLPGFEPRTSSFVGRVNICIICFCRIEDDDIVDDDVYADPEFNQKLGFIALNFGNVHRRGSNLNLTMTELVPSPRARIH
jgi:hypothetical protein